MNIVYQRKIKNTKKKNNKKMRGFSVTVIVDAQRVIFMFGRIYKKLQIFAKSKNYLLQFTFMRPYFLKSTVVFVHLILKAIHHLFQITKVI